MRKDGRVLRLVLIVVVIGSIECQQWLRPSHPLCVSQFALANRACAHLPIYTVPPPTPTVTPPPPLPPSGPPVSPESPGVPLPPAPGPLPAPLPPVPLPPGPPLDNDGGGENRHRHHRGGHHHHRRPYLHEHHNNNTHHHHHHHRHDNENDHRGHGDQHDHERRRMQEDETGEGTPIEEECCHWLEQVDTDCVCEILVNLPPFLSKPLHEYTVIVSHVCSVTYACPSRIRI